MKKLDCIKSAGKIKDAALGMTLGGTALAVSSLLIACLLAVGCSQKQNKSAGTETQTSTNQMTLNQPTTPNMTASASTGTTNSEPKKIAAKKKPSTVVQYSDPTYGVSFRYPRKYTLKSGDNVDLAVAPMDFVQPGGVPTVSVELPKGLYPDTDLASAFFRVNVNKGLTETECSQFALPVSLGSDKAPAQPTQIGLGALEMLEAENISGEETKQLDTKYYHLFQNGACYEFALGLSRERDVKEDGTTTVDREKVFQRLETILATVKIKPEATPQVGTGALATPTAHDEAVK